MAKVKFKYKNQLPEGLRDKYEIVGNWPDKFEMTGLEVKHIHWATMTEAMAKKLVGLGWKGLKLKKIKGQTPAVTNPDPENTTQDPEDETKTQDE